MITRNRSRRIQGIKGKQKRVKEYLTFLRTLNESSEDYLYLMDLQNARMWIFGGIEEKVDLGKKQEMGCYGVHQWTNAIHAKDRWFLEADIASFENGSRRSHNMDYRVADRDGGYIWMNCQGTVKCDEDGKPFLLVGRISEMALRYKIDSLTGVFNYDQLHRDMEAEMENGRDGYLILLGIDRMSNINTIHGREVGDQVLRQVANVIEEETSAPKVYRFGGDVFAVPKFSDDPEEVKRLFARIQKRLRARLTVSAGAVRFDLAGKDYGTLIQYAEFALEATKRSGKDALTIFCMDDYLKVETSMSQLNELVESVKNGCQGFSLVYQPQIRTGTYGVFGAEALLRYESLAMCRRWREKMSGFHMSVNMSYAQLSREEIVEDVLSILDESGVPGEALAIEVTESMQLQDYSYYNDIFAIWKKRGIEISVDDFGTGYSSLSYLKNLNVDEIKIDRCFVSGIHVSSYNFLLLSNMMQLAAEAQMRVCCEGVEEVEELQVLQKLHPALLQGYLFSKPCEADAFERSFLGTAEPEYMERLSGSKKNRIVDFLNLQHWDILRSLSMGLWVLRIADDGERYELYIDETMRRLLGMREHLSPTESFRFWNERISREQQDALRCNIARALETGRMTRVQYEWNHPDRGRIEVCAAGVKSEAFEGEMCLQGYHWVLSDADDPVVAAQDE